MGNRFTQDHSQADRSLACCPRFLVWTLAVSAGFCLMLFVPDTQANHSGHTPHAHIEDRGALGEGREVPGAPFRVFLRPQAAADDAGLVGTDLDAALQTVIDTFSLMLQHRTDYPRFDESLTKAMLAQVVIEPVVVNDEGKAFPFLVTRTKEPGRVILLIGAGSLKEKGYLHHPENLAPVLAREFHWVVSKADTAPKVKAVAVERHLQKAPIVTDEEIAGLSAEERVRLLQQLFDTYVRTVDDQNSLDGQSWYEVGNRALIPPTHADSTTKLYDIRIREALQKIVRDPSFLEQAPKAVRSLLNGKIWNVAYVKIDQRDWATRTRVLPEEKSVLVGKQDRRIQPAAVLINVHRSAAPDDPFGRDTQGLPMGALSPDQLARVIALEIQHNIQEKSQTGHTAQDALTAPR